ncbi:hypothetical protein EDB86DRAFT_2824833 [Lactarius hatsudake]|nr:hypothetical protein EDB86DRAFT_2824833 [Lactarius hatsudake]
MALAATLSAAPSLWTRTLTGVELNSVGYPTTRFNRVVDECSFPHVLAGGHVVRWVGHLHPVTSQDFVLRTDESITGLDCRPSSIKTDATILTLFPAPALSRKFLVTLAVVVNSAPDTSTLSAGHTNDHHLHSLSGITDNTAFANTQVMTTTGPSSPLLTQSAFCYIPSHLSTFSIRTSMTIATVHKTPHDTCAYPQRLNPKHDTMALPQWTTARTLDHMCLKINQLCVA